MSARARHGRLVDALARLSERERRLLALLGLVIVPIAAVFLGIAPMLQARDEARRAADEAQALLAWVSEQVQALPAEGARPPEAKPAPIGISAVEQSLVQAGLRERVVDLSNREAGGLDLALDGAEFRLLAAWLAEVAPDWGYRVAAFRIERGDEPGLVRATFELAGDG